MQGDTDGALPTESSALREHQGKGCTCFLTTCIVACVVGTSFQFGYNAGVINAPGEAIQQFINTSHEARYNSPLGESQITLIYSIIVAVWAVGGMIGGFVAGSLMEKVGRRGTMVFNNIGFILGGLLTMFGPRARSYEMMIFGRFFTGISCGVATCVAPVYLSEISPVALRGAIGTVHQLVITFAIFISQVLSLQQLLGGPQLWPYLFGVPLVASTLQLILMQFCPETPQYLFMHKSNYEGATKALLDLRGSGNDLGTELKEMQEEKQKQESLNEIGVCDLFRNKFLRRTVLIAMMLQLSQQLTGINGVIYYSDNLFINIGFRPTSAHYATLGVMGIMMATTFVSVFLVDIAGRRILHLLGLGGMAVAGTVLTVGLSVQNDWSGYLDIVSAAAFTMAFAIGPGSIPWLIVAEIFAQNARSAAMSLAVLTNWVANFVIAQTFPFLQKSLNNFVFIPFVVLCLLFFLLTYIYMPETKGKTIDEIQQDMRTQDGYGSFDNESSSAVPDS